MEYMDMDMEEKNIWIICGNELEMKLRLRYSNWIIWDQIVYWPLSGEDSHRRYCEYD